MKSISAKLIVLLTAVLLLVVAAVAKETTATFKVTGMYCDACQTAIEQALSKTDGVKSASVDWKQGSATVVYDDAKVNPEQISKVIQEKGFKAELEKRQQ